MATVGKQRKSAQQKPPSGYVPARPYRTSPDPRTRRPASAMRFKAKGHPGRYTRANGGPGRGPYPWKQYRQSLPGRSSGGAFVPAPAESHLDEFMFFDARVLNYDMAIEMQDWYKLPPVEVDRILRICSAGESILKVRFDDGSEYEYYLNDHERMESIWNLMRNAAHPGAIVWSNLIEPQIPYAQTVWV